MKELIRDYTISKLDLFDCRTAKRITWAFMAFAVCYFVIVFLRH